MRFFGTDDDVFFVEEERTVGGQRKSLFSMTADELRACLDKQDRNIAADYERREVFQDPFLIYFLD